MGPSPGVRVGVVLFATTVWLVKRVVGGGSLAMPVGVAVEDEFVGGGLEPVDRGLGEQWVGHQAEPLDRCPDGGHERRCAAVSFDDQFVDVGGVERIERGECEVVNSQQVDAEELADLGVVAVLESARAELLEESVAAFEVDAEPAPGRGVTERCGEEGLADPDRSEDQRVVAGLDEAQ